VLVDVAFKGVSVEPDFEDIESSYGKKVCEIQRWSLVDVGFMSLDWFWPICIMMFDTDAVGHPNRHPNGLSTATT